MEPAAQNRSNAIMTRRVGEVLAAPGRAVVVGRGERAGERPVGEAVAAVDVGVDVLVEVDDREHPAGPGAVEQRVVALQEGLVVRALRRLDGGPDEGDAERVDPPGRGAVEVRGERGVVAAPREVEGRERRELAPAAGVDAAEDDDAAERVAQRGAVGVERVRGERGGRERAGVRGRGDGVAAAAAARGEGCERGEGERAGEGGSGRGSWGQAPPAYPSRGHAALGLTGAAALFIDGLHAVERSRPERLET